MEEEHIKAKIVKKEEVAKGTLYVAFDLLGKYIDFKPGQYFHVLLKEGVKHHLTIVNSPNRRGIISMITRIRDSVFKQTLVSMPIGSSVEIYKVKGEFVLPNDFSKPIVGIALGIGITPYLSMLDYIGEERLPIRFTLLYSDSDTASMVRVKELDDLSKHSRSFKLIRTVTKDPAWAGEKRHIDYQFVKDYIPEFMNSIFYISGAPAAVESVKRSLVDGGIPEAQIKTEGFSGY